MVSNEDNQIVRSENDELELVIYSVLGDRQEQQDSFGYNILNNKLVCIICDGMGGHKGGKIASKLAVSQMLRNVDLQQKSDYQQEMISSISEIDEAILGLRDESDIPLNAGSTIASICVSDNKLFWAAVGDSRVYLFRNKKYVQLTKDQNYRTYLDEKLHAGEIDTVEYNSQCNRKEAEALINYLGIGNIRKSLFIDCNMSPFELLNDDILIIMSDGVYKILDNNEMCSIVNKFEDIVDVAQNMELKMIEKSGKYQIERDNTTLAVIKIKNVGGIK